MRNLNTTMDADSHWKKPIRIVAMLVALALPAMAEENPISSHTLGIYEGASKIVVTTAEKMPEDKYGFRPVDTVRSFGQIIGHIADTQYFFCATVMGEKNPRPQAEKTLTSKSELVAVLKEAAGYCARAYESMTDESGVETVKIMGGDKPKLGALHTNVVHTIEHYGNLVTYMRMNGIVPPTSDPEFMKTIMD